MMRGWRPAAVLCPATLPAPAQDLEREARWRADAVPPSSSAKPSRVLDVQGDADLPAVLQHAAARRRVAESTAGGKQVTIAGADHFHAGRQAEPIGVIAAFAASNM